MMLPGNSCERTNVVTGGRRKGRGQGWKTGRVTPNLPHWAIGRTQGRIEGKGSESLLEEAEEQMENTHS